MTKYEPVPTSTDAKINLNEREKNPFSRTTWIVLFVAFTICVSSSIFLAVVVAARPCRLQVASSPKNVQYTCGKSLEGALEKGCTFDILSMNWLPPECARDQTDDFIDYAANETWVYYRDRHAKHSIDSTEELAELGSQFWWSTQREHMVHCAFMILRLHKVLERGGSIDHLTGSFGHTKHCVMMLLDASKADPQNDIVNTPGNIAFGSC